MAARSNSIFLNAIMPKREDQQPCSSLSKEPLWLGFEHDGYAWASFAEYRAIRCVLSSASGRDMAAVVQSWFTFGLIESVIEKQVSESSLIKKTENGKSVISKDRLPEILEDWIDRIYGTTEKDELAAWSDRIQAALTQAHSLMTNLLLMNAFSYPSADADDIPSTIWLIGTIAEELTNVRLVVLGPIPWQGYSWSFVSWIYGDRYRSEMVSNGWCPFMLEYLSNTESLPSLEYASMKKPLEQSKNHRRCSKSKCSASVVDVDNYIPQHKSSNCTCEHTVPSLEAIEDHLAKGQVSVIAVSNGTKENYPVNISVCNSSDAPYIAFSHVWADGLGSTTEKGLPSCQVQRLASLASKLVSNGAFWIDALCIPGSKETRKLAIGLMAQIYRNAAAVLVLDKGIQMCSSMAALEEKLLRVFVSGWMQRLWTLQEAVLAKELVFLFSDALVPLSDLLPPPRDLAVSALKMNLGIEISRLSKRSIVSNFSIGDIERSLRWRATSRASDETLAIASLLGVEPSILVNLPPEERMFTLLLAIRKLPSDILFLAGPKLKISGFHWAPVSLMTAYAGLYMSNAETDAICTRQGLISVYTALTFRPSTINSGQAWKLKDVIQNRSYLVIDASTQVDSYRCDTLLLYGQHILVGDGTTGVAVLQTSPPSSNADGEFVVHCEYQRPLMVYIPLSDSHDAREILVNAYGRLKVCVS